jgi:hypothetical protein
MTDESGDTEDLSDAQILAFGVRMATTNDEPGTPRQLREQA